MILDGFGAPCSEALAENTFAFVRSVGEAMARRVSFRRVHMPSELAGTPSPVAVQRVSTGAHVNSIDNASERRGRVAI